MSHAIGAIKFQDGAVRFYEYNGTSDLVIGRHYATTEEVHNNWRNHTEPKCQHNKEEDVSIYADYASGIYMKGKACKCCGSLTGERDEYGAVEDFPTERWASPFFI